MTKNGRERPRTRKGQDPTRGLVLWAALLGPGTLWTAIAVVWLSATFERVGEVLDLSGSITDIVVYGLSAATFLGQPVAFVLTAMLWADRPRMRKGSKICHPVEAALLTLHFLALIAICIAFYVMVSGPLSEIELAPPHLGFWIALATPPLGLIACLVRTSKACRTRDVLTDSPGHFISRSR